MKGPRSVRRVKGTKGKKWKKGHSSDSNPQSKLHREAAKNKYFSINAGPSSLTVSALEKHDANSFAFPGQDDGASMDTQSHASFNTWATNWTDCTNATFSKVHRYWRSDSAMQKEILAVLAAVTEVIKQQGGRESNTEYFGILMTTLNTVEDETSLAATLYLLKLAIKKTPENILRKCFSDAAKKLLDLLENHADSETSLIVREALECLVRLLKVQSQQAWSSSSTMQVYRSLLAFTIHAKPKVRKCAQHGVQVVLKTPPFMLESPTMHHPAAAATATYCIKQIEQAGADATTTLHLLGLLQHLLCTFPQNSLKAACETILRAMTLANVVVTSVGLRTLHGLFISNPSVTSLPPPLNAQIITALYDYQPGEQDTQPMAAWMTVMEAAHINLSKNDEELCLRHLPRMVKSCMKCLLREDSAKCAIKSLTAVITTCLPSMRSRLAMLAKGPARSPVHEIIQHLEGGLSYQYHAAWGNVLNACAAFFKTVGSEVAPLSRKLLLSMSDLRDSPNFPHRGEVDAAVGAAVKSMGPKAVLEAVPLKITGEEDNYDFPRSWLVPVIRDNVTHTQLAFFVSYFLPLAGTLRTKSLDYEFGGRVVEAKSYDALQNQIWSMLPGFCTHPTDLPQSFKGIAKILGELLNTRPDLRFTVLAALRKLIQHSLEDDASREVMARFAKNYIPIFFNLYTAKPEADRDPKRMAVLETAKVYFQIADPKLTSTLYNECLNKMGGDGATEFRTHALMDLVILLLPYVELVALEKLYPVVVAALTDFNKTTQKKSYRVLEEICSSSSAACKALVSAKLIDLQKHLAASLSSSSPSARAPRLRCLSHILDNLDNSDESMEFLRSLVPEAVLCTKEVAKKARDAALSLLSKVGSTLGRWREEEADVQKEMFNLLLAGLGGSPPMVSCTVKALKHIIKDFKDKLEISIMKQLVNITCLLLRSKAREIVKVTVPLMKQLLSIVPESILAQSLTDIVGSLVAMKEDNKHHLRFCNKEIYERLIRKFGYEVILKLVPESHHKILINIKKTLESNKRKKEREQDDDSEEHSEDEAEYLRKVKPETVDELLHESDSEMEEEEEDKKKKRKSAKDGKKKDTKGAAWIKEGDDEDIVDFLDPAANKKVLATKPTEKPQAAKIKHDFKTASDGRLIITEGSDDEEDGKIGKGMEEEEDLEDLINALGGPKKSKKRKMMDVDDDEDEALQPGYKPGGSGIHRDLGNKRKAEAEPGAEYRAKKAKGDVKKKGKADPYAYLPLDIKTLNRRKKAKVKGQFSNLVKGAQKGALKGKKMRTKGK